MSTEIYHYDFEEVVPTEEIEASLILAVWSCEALHGEAQVRLDAAHFLDVAERKCVIDANTEHFIFEITGRVSKIEQFISIMKPLGLVEVCRTGVAAMNRGAEGM